MAKNFIILLSLVALIIAIILIFNSGERQKNEVENKVGQNEMTLRGTLEYVELEGGCYRFNSEDGSSYELYGLDEDKLKELLGKKLSINGFVNNDMASICQIGPIFEVTSYKIL